MFLKADLRPPKVLLLRDAPHTSSEKLELLSLPTPLTLVCGGNPIILLLVHQPAYLSIWPAAPSLQRGLSTNPGVTSVLRMWVQLKRWCVWVLHRGHSGDGCDLVSTLCKYDLRKGDLFVLSWARVRRVRWEVSPQSC